LIYKTLKELELEMGTWPSYNSESRKKGFIIRMVPFIRAIIH